MKNESLVLCIKGHPGVLEENQYYTVRSVTKQGHLLLHEVEPPLGYNSFHGNRFVPVQTKEEGDVIIVKLLTPNTTTSGIEI